MIFIKFSYQARQSSTIDPSEGMLEVFPRLGPRPGRMVIFIKPVAHLTHQSSTMDQSRHHSANLESGHNFSKADEHVFVPHCALPGGIQHGPAGPKCEHEERAVNVH